MNEFIFRKNLWILDLVVCASFGAFFGRTMQIEADSEGLHPHGILLATFVGGFSYVLAYVISFFLRKRFSGLPSWFLIGVGGSIIYAFGNGIIVFSVISWDPNLGRSISEHFRSIFPNMISTIVAGIVLLNVLIIPFLLFIRTVAYFIKLLFAWTIRTPLR